MSLQGIDRLEGAHENHKDRTFLPVADSLQPRSLASREGLRIRESASSFVDQGTIQLTFGMRSVPWNNQYQQESGPSASLP